MKKSNYVLKNINVLNALLLTVSVIMFFLLAYPLFSLERKADSAIVNMESLGKVETIAPENTPVILDYFVLSEKSFSQPLLLADIKINVPKEKDIRDMTERTEEKVVSGNVPTGLDYIVVAEKNLFHPERRMPAAKKEEQVVVRPDVIYYGSIITSDKRIAYVEDKKNPYSTPGRGKRQTPLAEGAMIGGYRLKEINPESIVLVHGDDKMVVNLRDQKDRKQGDEAINAQVRSGRTQVSPSSSVQTSRSGAIPQPPAMRPTSPLPGQRPGPKSVPSSGPHR